MADAKQKDEFPPRTFVKELRDGTKLTRTVTRPNTEVAAKFDGFVEQAGGKSSSSSSSSRPAGSTS